jgi:hypothetical protein
MNRVSLIYDYVDENGVYIVRTWLDAIDPKAKAKLNVRFNNLEQANRAEWIKYNTEVLSGDKDGLIAVRVEYNKIQYRILGYDGPNRGEFTLLACGKERNDKYIPRDIGKIANERITAISTKPNARRICHDFG